MILLDGEEKVALLDDGAIGKMDLLQIAFDARYQFDRVYRGGIAGEFDIFGHALDLGDGYGDRRA